MNGMKYPQSFVFPALFGLGGLTHGLSSLPQDLLEALATVSVSETAKEVKTIPLTH